MSQNWPKIAKYHYVIVRELFREVMEAGEAMESRLVLVCIVQKFQPGWGGAQKKCVYPCFRSCNVQALKSV